jgi:hypothetical protein
VKITPSPTCVLVIVALARLGRAEPPPVAETRTAAESRETASRPDSRATSRAASSPDVPEGSKDPVVDGMKAIVGELMRKGFTASDKDRLAERIRLVLEVGDVGEDVGRRREATALAATLLEIQTDYAPKRGPESRAVLTEDEERRVRVMAETLSRDLYRRLPKAGPAAGRMIHAAPTITPPAGYELVAWSVLGGFEYTEGMPLPEPVRKLHGRKVAIAGYAFSTGEFENAKEFVLVESPGDCCFGRFPSTHQIVHVTIAGRRGIDITGDSRLFAGTLEVGEEMEDGFVSSVYRLKIASAADVRRAD